MIEFAGVGSMINVPSRMADCTLLLAIQDNPGAMSRRNVGSISSVNVRLTNRHSLRGRRSTVLREDRLALREEGAEGGGESFPEKEAVMKYAELGPGTVEG